VPRVLNFVILQDTEYFSFVPLKSIANSGYCDPKNIASSPGNAKYYSKAWAKLFLIHRLGLSSNVKFAEQRTVRKDSASALCILCRPLLCKRGQQ